MARPAYTDSQREAIRGQILVAARTLWSEEGFDGVSIRRIAERVESSPMRIYHYFENKQEILRHIWSDILDDVFDRIEARLEGVEAPG